MWSVVRLLALICGEVRSPFAPSHPSFTFFFGLYGAPGSIVENIPVYVWITTQQSVCARDPGVVAVQCGAEMQPPTPPPFPLPSNPMLECDRTRFLYGDDWDGWETAIWSFLMMSSERSFLVRRPKGKGRTERNGTSRNARIRRLCTVEPTMGGGCLCECMCFYLFYFKIVLEWKFESRSQNVRAKK